MPKLTAVLFDLDGTLLDTAPDFYTVLNQLLAEENAPPISRDKVRRTVSNGARALIRTAFAIEVDHPRFDRLLQRLLDLYAQHLAVDTQLFPGIAETLLWLQQNRLAWGIVTNKHSRFTDAIVEQLNLAPDVVICPDHVTNTKPDPEPLLLACEKINCQPAQVVYVGDHLRDVDSGRAAGCITIGTAYGYIAEGDSAYDWNAHYVVESALELPELLTQLNT